ncbi:hypothetical protein ElyMa_001091200 [Elysia marginata]|uniref:Protein kinase domain-containing protein n=1 Tax=Elysia marginata TaxID=1093978 RepID=A0AAV4HTD6_9GAST|nr:hypothetical protein ElyMa_001091200 [Elysia marginata]
MSCGSSHAGYVCSRCHALVIASQAEELRSGSHVLLDTYALGFMLWWLLVKVKVGRTYDNLEKTDIDPDVLGCFWVAQHIILGDSSLFDFLRIGLVVASQFRRTPNYVDQEAKGA